MGNLYDTILGLCESKGIKGAKLCTDTGISKGLLTDLKMGRRTGVSAVTAQKIAAYFGVSVGYLLGTEADGDKKEQPINYDELSDVKKKLISRLDGLSDEKIQLLLQVAESIE